MGQCKLDKALKHLALLIFLTLVGGSISATTIFVSPTGDEGKVGQSWTTATTLNQALATANSGDEVWVLAGTYVPTTDENRFASFVIPAGVKVYGGFRGNENSPGERSADKRSVLSGNIGNPQVDSDNSYTVVTMRAGTGAPSLIDGFKITEGTARGFTQGFGAINAGGALYIEATPGVLPAHQVINCKFSKNKAHNGGAIYVSAGATSFENCHFLNNHADSKGGAIYNMGQGTELHVKFLDCYFQDNAAKYGGAMTNNGENGVAVPLLVGCQFVDNVAKSNGSSIYNMTNEVGECSIITEACLFQGNASILGDDVATKGGKKSLAQLKKESNNIGIIISGGKAKK